MIGEVSTAVQTLSQELWHATYFREPEVLVSQGEIRIVGGIR